MPFRPKHEVLDLWTIWRLLKGWQKIKVTVTENFYTHSKKMRGHWIPKTEGVTRNHFVDRIVQQPSRLCLTYFHHAGERSLGNHCRLLASLRVAAQAGCRFCLVLCRILEIVPMHNKPDQRGQYPIRNKLQWHRILVRNVEHIT